MDAERWEWIQNLFHEASAKAPDQRIAFLNSACPDDPDAVAEVLGLLEEDEESTPLLDQDIAGLAWTAIADAGDLAGRTAGPYRILEVLGRGGMGVVYLAEREDLGNRVALKVLPNAWMSPARRQRFDFEARTLSRLIHPSIARLYDAGTFADGTPWFAMEYVEGIPLTRYPTEHDLPLDGQLRLFRSVCEAVQFAHSQAILHRDLKPSNILVKENGEIRLLDFGIARQLDETGEDVAQTRTGLRLATPEYAAPEQLQGKPAVVQDDVYSLGAILFELLTGRRLSSPAGSLPGPDAAAQAEKPSSYARARFPASKSTWNDLDLLSATAAHADPQRRYSSVEALIRDIDHLLQNEPLDARPDDLGYRLSKFVRRHNRALIAGSLAAGMFVAMAVWFTARLTSARDGAIAEAARTRRIERFMLNLFEGGDENAGPAENLRVITLVDRSARQSQAFATDPSVRADLDATLGSIYQNLGKFDRADDFLRRALAVRSKARKPDDAQVSESLVSLGMLRLEQGKFEDAERLVQQGLDRARNSLSPDHPAVRAAMSALGRIYMDRSQYDKAVDILQQVLRLETSPGDFDQDRATTLIRMANADHYLGRYDEAESLNREVLEKYRRAYGERHPMLADPLINLGAIAEQRARFAESEAYYRQALAINRDYYGSDHPEVAACLLGIGASLTAQGRIAEAEAVLKNALTIRQRVYGPNHPFIATILSNLGNLALQQGNLDLAERQFRRMEQIYRANYGDHHDFVAVAISDRASVALARKDYAGAEKLARDVIRRCAEILPQDHPNVGYARVRLSRALLGEHRYHEAEQESLWGIAILEKNGGPSSAPVQAARKDLEAIRQAMSQQATVAN